ncbi:hypothetical protein Ccrd_004733 [Cynara cardunculus var. scolymus]|uniref:DUF4408 domain-containing protein n=1 Tax=Cynara cardunculus var. scolymus TaxID=59895 RepID=A0A103XMI0_CYNCS|nr:hypothetical protein Ccrd_004733 [Cynara cardunculus var. scolymus]
MDMFVFLTMISRFSAQLPFGGNFSGYHFRGLSFTNCSPMFAFVTGNAIILLLLFKSRLVKNGDGDDDNGGVDFYNEYFKSYEKSLINSTTTTTTTTTPSDTTVIVPNNGYTICRSRSEDLTRVKRGDDETHRKLRRSVTERRRLKNLDHRCGGYAEDKMSSEEFRRTVEAFIAKQQKSLRDEEFSPLVYVGA